MLSRAESLRWARVAGLVGGILIAVGGVVNALLLGAIGALVFSGAPRFLVGLAAVWGGLAFLAGLVAVLASTRVERTPRTWGWVLVVAGALGFVAGGGFFVGSAGAIAGGVLALTAPEGPTTPYAGPPVP